MLRELQQAALPNIPLLRGLIGWFNAVSDALDQSPQIVASASVDSAGVILKNFGFDTPGLHPGTGQYALDLLDTTYDINDLIPFANVTNVGTPGGAINIYPAMSTGSQVFINIWQIAITNAARTAVDQEFMVWIIKNPAA